MRMWFIVWLGLAADMAYAVDRGVSPGSERDVAVSWLEAPTTRRGVFGGRGAAEALNEEVQEKRSAEELATQARLDEVAAASRAREARVVVIKWPETDASYENEAIQRNIRSRIARSDAMFYPEIDLYQAGRREPDREILHAQQRAVVPEDAPARVMAAVDATSAVPWNALSEQEWSLKANSLRQLADAIWFVDRPELREPLFLLYAQIGRAADASGDGSPPFYEQVGGHTVNYYWFLAGAMAKETPALLSKLTDRDVNESVSRITDAIQRGDFPMMTLSFDDEGGVFDINAFAAEYQVFFNGLEDTIKDENGLYFVPPGRVDIRLERGDGHSLSERIAFDKLDDKIYFVRDVARKRMGLSFKDELLAYPNECVPPLSEDILTYLAIYQRLHPTAEVYVALPRGGSVAPHHLLLWRWDPVEALLKRVQGQNEFPVRFALTTGTGLTFSGAAYTPPPISQGISDETTGLMGEGGTTSPTDLGDRAGTSAANLASPSLTPTPSGLPVMVHLRGHYNRLMVQLGLHYATNITPTGSGAGEGPVTNEKGQKLWADKYQTNHRVDSPGHELVDMKGNVTLRERRLQRLVHLGVGVVLGKNAAIGFGPRGYLRTGWYNAPHAVDLTAHAGYAALAPWAKAKGGEIKNRVNPLVDVDAYGGIMLPYRDSLFITSENNTSKTPLDQKIGKAIGTFGFTLEAGSTF
jgi:hypothetical protein